MPKGNRREWRVEVHGEQREEIDVDLLAQLVVMLGRQLAHESLAVENSGDQTREEEEL